MAIKKVKSKRTGKWVWAYDERIAGRRKRDSGFATRDEAEAVVASLKLAARADKYGLPRAGKREKVTAADLLQKLADEARNNRYQKDKRRQLGRFAALCQKSIRDLTTLDLKEYATARTKAGIQPQTVNTELCRIGAALSEAGNHFASLEGYTPPKLPLLPVSAERRDRILSEDEAARILTLLRTPKKWHAHDGSPSQRQREVVADVLEIELRTSLRISDVLNLKKSDCNFHWNTLRATSVKTKTVRILPMGSRVREICLRRCEGKQDHQPLFAGVANRSKLQTCYWLVDYVRDVLKWACEQLNIPYGRKTPGGITNHDTRHTATSALLHAGHDLATVMAITGHSGKTMALHYGHATQETKLRAVSTLDEFGVQLESTTNSVNSPRSVNSAKPKTRKAKR